ncbi:MAG: dienelactone hydrolase [Porticoccaceae bacterium]|nr:dienelactone hydrolase [Porticoccaceae bacterium]
MKFFRPVLKICALATLAAISPVSGAGEPVNYALNGKNYQGYLARAENTEGGAAAPTVLIFHDWDGLTDYEIRRADMLASKGYNAFAADLFGADVKPTTTEEKQRHTAALLGDRKRMLTLMQAAIAAAGDADVNLTDAVAMGYCLGGAAVLDLARAGTDLKGFATFHGVLTTPEGEDFSRARGKVLVLHGTADTAVTMDQFADLANMLEKSQTPHEMITYGGAQHAFTVFGIDRYHPEADGLSWHRFLAFLDETLAR